MLHILSFFIFKIFAITARNQAFYIWMFRCKCNKASIWVKKNGQSFKIRLVWVEAPENTTTRYWYTQCYWQASTDYLAKLLLNKYVWLEYDMLQNWNSYDRELAYVIFEWENISKKIIEEWYWRAYTWDYKYKSEFLETEHEAERLEKWLWNKNTCNWEHKKWK